MDALAFLDKAPKTKQPIIVLFGDEGFLLRRCREAVIARALGDADPEFALAVYPGDGADFAEVRTEVETLPFLAPVRIVLIEAADKFITEHREKLEHYAAKPSKSGVLILEAKTFPETTKLAKALPDAAKIACKSPAPYKLPEWTIGWAKSAHGKTLSRDAATMLFERVGPQMGLLASEIDKLANAVGDKSEITAADVDRLVARSREADVFRILNAIGDGQPAVALGVLNELFEAGEAPLGILGAMTWQLRKLAAFERHLATGLPAGPAMDAAGVPKWPDAREKFDRQVRHLGRRRLQLLTQWIMEVNQGLKGQSPLPPELQVERLVAKLARPRAA
jgi:DNA polymerase-3 subunit delta